MNKVMFFIHCNQLFSDDVFFFPFFREQSEAPSKAPRKRTRSFGEEISSGWKSKKIHMGKYVTVC